MCIWEKIPPQYTLAQLQLQFEFLILFSFYIALNYIQVQICFKFKDLKIIKEVNEVSIISQSGCYYKLNKNQ